MLYMYHCCHGYEIDDSFNNMLGAAAEKCEPLVCLTSAHDESLIFLEVCVCTYVRARSKGPATLLQSCTGCLKSYNVLS